MARIKYYDPETGAWRYADSAAGVRGRRGVHYIATDYGIRAGAEDNTPALQALIDLLHARGGGVIWFPPGTYDFRKRAEGYEVSPGYVEEYAIWLRSNVSIVGESITGTVLRQVDPEPYALFYCKGTADEPLTGCSFSGFTVDAYGTGDVNRTWGKAFFAQYLKSCVFRELVLRGTTATALGVDFLDQVRIENITCVDCGRTYAEGCSGSAGIGIGTGGWEHENFIISQCVCTGSGQYGIFVENQPFYGWGGEELYPKGCIITGCITRGGLNHGIGIIGGKHITVEGCQSYENANHGIYVAGSCSNVLVDGCMSADNGGCGLGINPEAESSGICAEGNVCTGNGSYGIRVSAASDSLCIRDNTTRGNAVGLSVREGLTLNDCVLYGNVCLDGQSIGATFTGNTQYIDAQTTTAPVRIELTAADLISGIKLMPDGSEAAETDARSTGYLDVSGMDGDLKITGTGAWNGLRVAQYDGAKASLVTAAELTPTAGAGQYALTVQRLEGCAYIRLFFAQFDAGTPATVETVVVEAE